VTTETSYTEARAHLASLLDRVNDNRETIVIKRRNGKRVALIDADELESLEETAYLLRSPANAERLLRGIERARQRVDPPRTLESLREEVGLDSDETGP